MLQQAEQRVAVGLRREIQHDDAGCLRLESATFPIDSPGIEACTPEVLCEAPTAGENLEHERPAPRLQEEAVALERPLWICIHRKRLSRLLWCTDVAEAWK